MDISKRVAILSIGFAAAAGLAFPAVFERSSTPELAPPVELSRSDNGDAVPAAVETPPAVPSDPVPVAPRVQRQEDDVRPSIDKGDDSNDRSGTRGDDDSTDDTNRPAARVDERDDDAGDDDSDDDAGDDDNDDDAGGDDSDDDNGPGDD